MSKLSVRSQKTMLLLSRGLACTALLMMCAPACGDDRGTNGTGGSAGNAAQTGGSVNGGSAAKAGSSDGGVADPSTGGAALGGSAGSGDGPVCGDATIEAVECEPPGSALCSDDCVEVATSACFDCEQASACYEFSENCLAFAGGEQSGCYDVHECVHATGCGDGEKTLTSCFCGELDTLACIEAPNEGAGAPNGACAEIIRLAMGGADATNSQVLTRYLNIEYPGGAAIARMNCDKLAPECIEVCGF